MIEKELLIVSLRQRALYLPSVAPVKETDSRVLAFVAQFREMGFAVSEPLLHALGGLSDDDLRDVLDAMNQVMGTKLNWSSLVRGWLTPTGESVWDHFVTFIANVMRQAGDAEAQQLAGTTLPCGHFIPDGTFPLERYNGCPFCGTPFQTAEGQVHTGQGGAGKLRLLTLWREEDLDRHLQALLASPVPLDATQSASLTVLLRHRPLPQPLVITIKETRMLVIDALVKQDRPDEAGQLFSSPVDVMRYLWYKKTGLLQLVEPRTLLHQHRKNQHHELSTTSAIDDVVEKERRGLKLKYDRRWCLMVAKWLNDLSMPVNQQLEAMHPKREMWVRFIRALRLAEYARRPGFTQLQTLLDRFYRRDYEVWQGRVDRSRHVNDAAQTLQLLQQRPGLFARSLFATMLWCGSEPTLSAFREVISQIAPRLLVSLGSTAEIYFDRNASRVVHPLGSVMKTIDPHPLLSHYTDAQLEQMKAQVRQLYLDAMRLRFALQTPLTPSNSPSLPFTPSDSPSLPLTPSDSPSLPLTPSDSPSLPLTPSIYIDPQLYNIPVSVGDRSATVQDISAALQGQRFPVSGDHVRLFLQWGKDLPAQHLDMDLSSYLLGDSEAYQCAYFNLAPEGACHSGDIRNIPDRVGTAEYIELNLPVLQHRGIRRVVFTCNAYSTGALSPNLMVGWMSAEAPMTVSDETGVAYDPSTVDHMVRITATNLSKGLIFGVLEVEQREIVWLEMPFDGQTVMSISPDSIDAYLRRLAARPTIGQLLQLKAEAQHLSTVSSPAEATEAYTMLWAQDAARVSALLLA